MGGGVAVLHPQDCLKQPFSNRTHFFSGCMKPSRNNTPNRANRRKKTPLGSPFQGTVQTMYSPVPKKTTMVNKIISPNEFPMGHVKILKRGEDLIQPMSLSDRVSDVVKSETAASNLASDDVDVEIVNNSQMTDRLGPEPEMLSKQIGVLGGFYAGSAIIASPPPSSLPLPGFFSKNNVIVNKHATNDLLRMLRLNLA